MGCKFNPIAFSAGVIRSIGLIGSAKENAETFYVYGLVDPRTKAVRYIGYTSNLCKRLQAHRTSKQNEPLRDWIGDLADGGAQPYVLIFDHTKSSGRAYALESLYIYEFMQNGADLFNRENVLADRERAEWRQWAKSRLHAVRTKRP